MRPRGPFEYPAMHSVTPLLSNVGPKFCVRCTKKGFVARAVIIASCGCGFHPICITELLQENNYKCPCCETNFSGSWMDQFGLHLTSRMKEDVSSMKKRLEEEAPLKSAIEPHLDEVMAKLELSALVIPVIPPVIQ